MLKDSLIRQPAEEDPDEGIKDVVDIALKKMVLLYVGLKMYMEIFFIVKYKRHVSFFFRIMTMMGKFLILILRRQ